MLINLPITRDEQEYQAIIFDKSGIYHMLERFANLCSNQISHYGFKHNFSIKESSLCNLVEEKKHFCKMWMYRKAGEPTARESNPAFVHI